MVLLLEIINEISEIINEIVVAHGRVLQPASIDRDVIVRENVRKQKRACSED